MLDAGVYRLKTKFVPDDPVNYTSASAQVEIIIRERPKFRSKLYWSILHDDEDVVTPSDAPVASEEANDLSILAVLNVRTSSKSIRLLQQHVRLCQVCTNACD